MQELRSCAGWCTIMSAAILVSCDVRSVDPSAPDRPDYVISDAVHNSGNTYFYFVPPIVPAPAFSGEFDASLEPVVEICEWNGTCVATIATFTATSGPGSEYVHVSIDEELYTVDWHSADFNLNPQRTYRIRVLIGTTEVGYADVDVVASGAELRNVDTGEFIGLKNGRTLPIKFRIEKRVFIIGSDGGAVGTIDGSATLSVPAGSLPGNVAITVQEVQSTPAGAGLIPGSVFDFQPDGTEFITPALLTLSYDETRLRPGLPEHSLTILTFENGKWREVSGAVVDPTANTVTAPISGFSLKAVGEEIDSIIVLPRTVTLAPHDSIQLTAQAFAGGMLLDRAFLWRSFNDTAVFVDSTGLVIARERGATVVRASVGGTVFGFAQITVQADAVGSVSGSPNHTCMVRFDGGGYCVGVNPVGQLGDGTTVDHPTPASVMGGHTFQTVTTGFNHTCGLTTSGAAYCWGWNARGNLGDSTTTDSSIPVPVFGGFTFTAIAAGQDFTCGLTLTGAAYCWGANEEGQLGNGHMIDQVMPTAVAGGLSFTSIGAGLIHACGLTAGGAMYCWGANYDGNLGDGTTDNRLTPVAVGGGLNFASLAVGGYRTCGLVATGQAYCWGAQYLGHGSTTSEALPVPVSGGLQFESLTLGLYHSCGLSAQVAYCWGGNFFGAVGDGTTTHRLTPAPVSGGFQFTALYAGSGSFHSCGVVTSGDLYCWGANAGGQLGDGSTVTRLEPRRIVLP